MHAVTLEEAREYYADADTAHGFDHVVRVLALAERIGALEGADPVILRTAALLHDIGRPEEMESGRSHAEAGAEMARRVLSDWPPNAVDAVAHAIASHRFRDDVAPETVEAKVLFDADKLDSIGAIGVARAYAVAGLRGQPLWREVEPGYEESEGSPEVSGRQGQTSAHTPAHEFAIKLSRIKDILFTDTARRIAEDRHRFMSDFFARLEREVQGEL